METVGWAAVAMSFLGGVFGIIRYVLRQIPDLAEDFAKAVKALRGAWQEAVRDGESKVTTSAIDTEVGRAALTSDRHFESPDGEADSARHGNILAEQE